MLKETKNCEWMQIIMNGMKTKIPWKWQTEKPRRDNEQASPGGVNVFCINFLKRNSIMYNIKQHSHGF